MDFYEYIRVYNMSYMEYFEYLQSKYGTPPRSYITEDWKYTAVVKKLRNPNSRTKEGLFIHTRHECLDMHISVLPYAKKYPFEYQMPHNLCYCDYLEHMLLHILICKYYNPKFDIEKVGAKSMLTHIMPALNDFYSGFQTEAKWEKPCVEKIINDKKAYLLMLNQIQTLMYENLRYIDSEYFKKKYSLHKSWSILSNHSLFREIDLYLKSPASLEEKIELILEINSG